MQYISKTGYNQLILDLVNAGDPDPKDTAKRLIDNKYPDGWDFEDSASASANNLINSKTSTTEDSTTNVSDTSSSNTSSSNTSSSNTSSSIVDNTKTDSTNTINGTTTEEQEPIKETSKEGTTINLPDKEETVTETVAETPKETKTETKVESQSPSENISDNNVKSDTLNYIDASNIYDEYKKMLGTQIGESNVKKIFDSIDESKWNPDGENKINESIANVSDEEKANFAGDASQVFQDYYNKALNGGDSEGTEAIEDLINKYPRIASTGLNSASKFIKLFKFIPKLSQFINPIIKNGTESLKTPLVKALMNNKIFSKLMSKLPAGSQEALLASKATKGSLYVNELFASILTAYQYLTNQLSDYNEDGSVRNWKQRIPVVLKAFGDNSLFSMGPILQALVDEGIIDENSFWNPSYLNDKEQRAQTYAARKGTKAYEKTATYLGNEELNKLPEEEQKNARAMINQFNLIMNRYTPGSNPYSLEDWYNMFEYDPSTHNWYDKEDGTPMVYLLWGVSDPEGYQEYSQNLQSNK